MYRNYVQFYHEYYEFDQFDSTFERLPNLDINLYTVNNTDIIYKSLDIFKGSIWPVRFHQKFASKLASFQENTILYTLSFVNYVADGNFVSKSSLSKE